LPFANELKAVVQSAELPVAVVAVVDSRLPADRARAFQAALLRIGHAAGESDTLASLRLKGFVPVQLPGHTAAP
jgi:ABC-type phosphate/phosphonate transport system substrate-binding protein